MYAKKSIFDKGSKANWTDEIFTVSKVFPTKPITYEITDTNCEVIQGKVYSYEMIKSNVNNTIVSLDRSFLPFKRTNLYWFVDLMESLEQIFWFSECLSYID